MKEINLNAIREVVAEMTVAQMRTRAKELGIENAKKYKRTELSELVFDALVVQAQAQAAQAKEAKEAKKGVQRAARGSNKNIDTDVAEVESFLSNSGNLLGDTIVITLLGYGRAVLIRVMADYKVKGWYRIYDKQTMAEQLVRCARAQA